MPALLRSVILVTALVLLSLRPASAMFMSSADLGRMCLSDRSQDIYGCTNYIAGVIDYHALMQSFGTAPTIDFCLPESVSKQQVAVIVMAYMRTSPQNDDFVAATVVPLALNKAFPCAVAKPAVKKKKK